MTRRQLLTKRRQRKLITLGITLAVAGLTALGQHLGWLEKATSGFQGLQPGKYKVAQFIDGDTVIVGMNGFNETIRFIGVDTPEIHDPRKTVQCFGQAAAKFTKQLIGDQPLRLEADPLNTNRDRYNRLLRFVYLPDNRLVNAEIIKQGYGFAYTSFPFTKVEEFKNYQTNARQHQRGLWKECSPQTNDYGGYTSNDAN